MCWWTLKLKIHRAVRDMNVGRVRRQCDDTVTIDEMFHRPESPFVSYLVLCEERCSSFLESAMESLSHRVDICKSDTTSVPQTCSCLWVKD